ncbi:MAG: efflux RND transporter permease subunit [Nodosilinea sp.]
MARHSPINTLSAILRARFFGLTHFAIAHPRLIVSTWLAVAVAGLLAFSTLKYALFPDFTFPLVIVNAQAPIPTLLETEATLTNPLEASLSPLEGVVNVRSTTYAGRTTVAVRYDIGRDAEAATAAVEGAVAAIALPDDNQVEVIPLNVNEEVAISYAVRPNREGELNTALVTAVETEILPVLEAIPGVLRVDLLGTGATANGEAPPGSAEAGGNLQSPPTLARFNGADALALQVIKRGDANTLEVVRRVEAEVANLDAALPQGELVLATTQASYIQEATQATIGALWQAIALAILVIFVFLRNWRATLITALAIPLSLLATFGAMAVAGFNLETITLLALALVIGIVVDDAIVEVENIIRHLDAGQPPRQAALAASREISLTVSVSTLTIVAVFLPVAFMGGTVGQFFKPFGLTVSAAVLASLLVARTLTPVLAVYWLRRPAAQEGNNPGSVGESAAALLIPEDEDNSAMTRAYGRWLGWSLGHRGWVVAFAIAAFAIGVALIPLVPTGFIPKLDRGEFNITYTAPLPQRPNPTGDAAPDPATLSPAGLAQLQAQASGAGVATAINPMQALLESSRAVALDLEPVALETPGVDSVFTVVGGRGAPNKGVLNVKLSPNSDLTTAQVQDQVRASLPDLPGVATSVEDIAFIDLGGEKPLQVILKSDDLEALYQAAQEIQRQVAALPGFVDVTLTGIEQEGDTVTTLEHRNGQRVAYISANLSEGQALGEATDQVLAIATATVPDSVTLDRGADSARVEEVLGGFLKTLGLSVVCMLTMLFLPFGRLLEPLVVGLSLPLAVVGAMVGLLVTQSDFGMAAVIGLLFLLGLLDKNALLLMDYANQLRQAGLNRTEALMKTGPVRFRPILMTTASTILGLAPVALGLGAGAELRQPMAVAIIGGLIASTLLSLLVVPVLYTLLEDGWQAIRKRG